MSNQSQRTQQRQKPNTDSVVPPRSDVVAPYTGHHDHSFTLQMFTELTKNQSENKAALEKLCETVNTHKDSIKSISDIKTNSEVTKVEIGHIKDSVKEIKDKLNESTKEITDLSKKMYTITIIGAIVFALIQVGIGFWIKNSLSTSATPTQQNQSNTERR